jgi:8-oxo-dGTP pyrophosphatase MutT (NUDIX family)
MTETKAAPPKDAIRDAATVVLVRRDEGAAPRVLMGQRGRDAAFMPSKFVFPGGAVDPADRALAAHVALPGSLASRLEARAPAGTAAALALAAIRELSEEAGLILATAGTLPAADLPDGWSAFCAGGRRPAVEALDFIFRAITPPGRPRRFDARFFLVDAAALASDPDAFDDIDHELAHLSWLTLDEARQLDLPFITEVVLAEVEARLDAPAVPRSAPFFRHEGGRSFFEAL